MSAGPPQLHLSPFAECGRTTSIVGYRDLSTDQVVTSVEIPSELIERAVLANVSVEIALSADGSIGSAANGKACVYSSAKRIVTVDQLVEAFLVSDNLHLEEATERDLRGLLERLQKSVRAVQRSIALLKQATD
jgi:hypothetical protein